MLSRLYMAQVSERLPLLSGNPPICICKWSWLEILLSLIPLSPQASRQPSGELLHLQSTF